MKRIVTLLLTCLAGPVFAALPQPDHVVIVIMENHSFSHIIGNPDAPTFNALANAGALIAPAAGDPSGTTSGSHGLSHPSQPNYLHLFSGDNQGVTADGLPGTAQEPSSSPLPFNTPNLGAQLVGSSFSFAIYSETLPAVGSNVNNATVDSGKNEYVRKHNPEVNWQANDAPANNHLPPSANQPFAPLAGQPDTGFPSDFTKLPTVSIVVPNEQHDMHDGTVAQGDAWLKANIVDTYYAWAKQHNSLLIITFDEDEQTARNLITTIFAGPLIKTGTFNEVDLNKDNPDTGRTSGNVTSSGTAMNHFNVLATIEDLYGLPHIGGAIRRPGLTDIFVVAAPTPTPTPTPPPPTPTPTPPPPTATPSPTPTPSATATPTPTATPSPTATPTPTPRPLPKLLNISTRMEVLTGNNVLIGGFIVTGTAPKKVLIRGLGPSLPVSAPLADPTLELHDKDAVLATNDNWKTDDKTGLSQEAAIRATTIPPKNVLESAIIAVLPANSAGYTAILRGKSLGTGVGQVEVYDLDASADSELANISTRGFVDTNDNVMIGGIIVGPNTAGSTNVLVRAIGPSLGIDGQLADPTLELHNSEGTPIATNDNWKIDDTSGASQQAKIEATKTAPKSELESALIETVAPGKYTAVVRGKNGGMGIALVEAYNLGP